MHDNSHIAPNTGGILRAYSITEMNSIAQDSFRQDLILRKMARSTDCSDYREIELELRPRDFQMYDVSAFTEEDDYYRADHVRRMQAECYQRYGYVDASAIDRTGALRSDLDGARGKNVIYFHGVRIGDEANLDNQCSIRTISIPKGEGLDSLPAYRNTKGQLYDGVEEALLNHLAVYPGTISEISALSRSKNAPSTAGLEAVREAIQLNMLKNEKGNIWLATFTQKSYAAIDRHFGAEAVLRIGPDIDFGQQHDGVSSAVKFVPAIINPSECLNQIAHEIIRGDIDESRRKSLTQGLMFLADGAPYEVMNPETLRLYMETAKKHAA